MHTGDAGVSVASVISSVAEVFDGDKRSEVIGEVDLPVQCWPHSSIVSSTNSCVELHVPVVILGLLGPLFSSRQGFLFAARSGPFDPLGELDAMDILKVKFHLLDNWESLDTSRPRMWAFGRFAAVQILDVIVEMSLPSISVLNMDWRVDFLRLVGKKLRIVLAHGSSQLILSKKVFGEGIIQSLY